MVGPRTARRCFAALLATFALLGFLSSLMELTGWTWISFQNASIQTFGLVAVVLSVLVIFTAITWPRSFSVMDAVIRCWMAFGISLYGFAKIFKTQFGLPAHTSDMRVSDLSGIELTWHYFGYSYTFAVLIGAVQIAGALMLAIHRAKIAGALLLLPIMFNILLINLFYEISPGALMNSVIFIAGLVYILAPQAGLIARAMFLPNGSSGKWQTQLIVAALIVMMAGLSIYQVRPRDVKVTGKFEVEQLTLGNDSIPTGIMNWKRVYVEQWGMIIFSANASMYSPDEAINGSYRFDEERSLIRLLFEAGYSEPDSVSIKVKEISGGKQEWTFPFQKNQVTLRLKKIK